MTKTNNKLILIFGILTFILGLLLVSSPAYARGGIVESGVNFTPYTYPIQYALSDNATPKVIPGCEGRNTGFSITTGQSCVGNYINNKNTNNNSNSNTDTTTANTTNKNSETTNTTVTNNTETTENTTTTNETENTEDFGGLTSNALLGSNSFMPTGLAQWIFLLIIIVAIIFLWRYVHAEEKYLKEPLKHA